MQNVFPFPSLLIFQSILSVGWALFQGQNVEGTCNVPFPFPPQGEARFPVPEAQWVLGQQSLGANQVCLG